MLHGSCPEESLRTILLQAHTVAIAGTFNSPDGDSRTVMSYLLGKGYDVIPVDPGLAGHRILSRKVEPTLTGIGKPIDLVNIFRSSEAAGRIIDDALSLPSLPKYIWLQGDSDNADAADRAEKQGIQIIRNLHPQALLDQLRN